QTPVAVPRSRSRPAIAYSVIHRSFAGAPYGPAAPDVNGGPVSPLRDDVDWRRQYQLHWREGARLRAGRRGGGVMADANPLKNLAPVKERRYSPGWVFGFVRPFHAVGSPRPSAG